MCKSSSKERLFSLSLFAAAGRRPVPVPAGHSAELFAPVRGKPGEVGGLARVPEEAGRHSSDGHGGRPAAEWQGMGEVECFQRKHKDECNLPYRIRGYHQPWLTIISKVGGRTTKSHFCNGSAATKTIGNRLLFCRRSTPVGGYLGAQAQLFRFWAKMPTPQGAGRWVGGWVRGPKAPRKF
jgi:hypothetical protein